MGFSLLPGFTSPADGSPILVLADSANSDVLDTNRDRHRTTASTFAYEWFTHTPYRLVVQRVDHREADRVLGSQPASGSSVQLRSFRLCVGVWLWVSFERVR